MEVLLQPEAEGETVDLSGRSEAEALSVGRVSLRIGDAKLSRKQARVWPVVERGEVRGVGVRCEGVNACRVRRAGAETGEALAKGETVQLRDGDVLCMLGECYPYRVVIRSAGGSSGGGGKRKGSGVQRGESGVSEHNSNVAKRSKTEENEAKKSSVPPSSDTQSATPIKSDERVERAVNQIREVLSEPQLDADLVCTALSMTQGGVNAAVELLLESRGRVERQREKESVGRQSTTSREFPAFSLCEKAPKPWNWYNNAIPSFSAELNRGTINIYGLVQGEGLQRAFITTYMVELEWLKHRFPALLSVPLWISEGSFGKRDCTESLDVAALPEQWSVTYPRDMLSYGVNHGKMWILEYETYLRVIITTANCISLDYNRKLNGIWMQDFPRNADSSASSSSAPPFSSFGYSKGANDFREVLFDYLQRLNCPMTWEEWCAFDFSGAAVALVSSVSGYHVDEARQRYGLGRLRHLLQCERGQGGGARAAGPVIAQFSSFGSLQENWLRDQLLHSMAVGTELESKPATSATLKFVWPTVNFVRNCLDGYRAGSSLCFAKRCDKRALREHLVYNFEGKADRSNVPPHIKTFYQLSDSGALGAGGSRQVDYFVLTSHNMSRAAWGELQLSKTQMMIRHFELGVVFLPSLLAKVLGKERVVLRLSERGEVGTPPKPLETGDAAQQTAVVEMNVPYKIPSATYGSGFFGNAGNALYREPWIWDKDYKKPDMYGVAWLPGK